MGVREGHWLPHRRAAPAISSTRTCSPPPAPTAPRMCPRLQALFPHRTPAPKAAPGTASPALGPGPGADRGSQPPTRHPASSTAILGRRCRRQHSPCPGPRARGVHIPREGATRRHTRRPARRPRRPSGAEALPAGAAQRRAGHRAPRRRCHPAPGARGPRGHGGSAGPRRVVSRTRPANVCGQRSPTPPPRTRFPSGQGPGST